MDSRKGQVRTGSQQACLLLWNSPLLKEAGSKGEPLSGLNQVAGCGGNGLRIPKSEGSSVPGLRICSLIDHGTKPSALLEKKMRNKGTSFEPL